ncbi:NAD-dependent epimerase/dehydratase family protein [Abyssalbus ytuae]|uniref:NAD-dependent epimerase/dehydratase family protein n=1 Tax=Abyssalbus ytuae TaxID=2926907 RepID=A0A9E6ZXR0_9FLAO|nr:NAD-dependent epimerase/dehydratase family protein [Abyssalbus ytuae]UOB18841.1 NAD-dependent epimerase/dehydratase family protein [Abyssalbus ytuae]
MINKGSERILIIGANGQLGSVLTEALKDKYDEEHVIASDLYLNEEYDGIFEIIDATNKSRIQTIVSKYNITQIYHLAAILSAKGEEQPLNTWEINMKTWLNVLEVSRISGISKVFYPSSIAVFGDNAQKDNTPQHSFLDPSTVYGISKVAGENWAHYYYLKYGLDVRSLRFPGIIGYQSMPGGGTTDYAVDIYHKAVKQEKFSCFLKSDTTLPMMFIDDAIRATLELMEAPADKIKVRTSYNISGVSFSPSEVVNSIQKIYPDFEVVYSPDFRQKIARNWPGSINDSEAKKDWGWKQKFNLDDITSVMINKLKEKYKAKSLI